MKLKICKTYRDRYFAPVETKLSEFTDSIKNVAANMEDGNYRQVADKLKEIEAALPESIAGMALSSIKNLLKDIAKVIEDYAQEETTGSEGKKPDFSKLQEVFEGYFMKMFGKE